MNMTHIDHTEYQKLVKSKSVIELMHTMKDAHEAERAMPLGHKAGYYLDEIHYCGAELRSRQTPLNNSGKGAK